MSTSIHSFKNNFRTQYKGKTYKHSSYLHNWTLWKPRIGGRNWCLKQTKGGRHNGGHLHLNKQLMSVHSIKFPVTFNQFHPLLWSDHFVVALRAFWETVLFLQRGLFFLLVVYVSNCTKCLYLSICYSWNLKFLAVIWIWKKNRNEFKMQVKLVKASKVLITPSVER